MTSKIDLAAVRREYSSTSLLEADALQDPHLQLQLWMSEALAAEVLDATAMSLSTVSAVGVPSSRVVLLKKLEPQGLSFFTRTSSRKADDMANNPRVALLFHWRELSRQVRIEGTAMPTSSAESLEYFASRPRESRLAARVASQQNTVTSRAELEQRFAEEAQRYPGDDVPMPDDWGGYRVTAHEYEFWQGRENRLHDRLRYSPSEAGAWVICRLAP